MRTRDRRLLALTAALPMVLGAAVAGVAVAGSARADSGTANFVGHWTPDTGIGWTVTSQSGGTCTGTADLSGYGFTNCTVTGFT